MRRVIIESPFAGDVPRNLRYLRAAMHDCLLRDEAPFASHALYTQPGVLDDGETLDRQLGIEAGFEWRKAADATVVYRDLGITLGMHAGIENSSKIPVMPIEYRNLGSDWEQRAIEREQHFKTKWP